MPSPDQPNENRVWGEPIYEYSRAQAILDGVLVDVTKTALEAGIRRPTAVTRAVWDRYVAVPDELVGWQDENGRLWDIVWMLRFGVLQAPDDSVEVVYELFVQNDVRGPQKVTLKSVCGPGDKGEPVVTIMLPEED